MWTDLPKTEKNRSIVESMAKKISGVKLWDTFSVRWRYTDWVFTADFESGTIFPLFTQISDQRKTRCQLAVRFFKHTADCRRLRLYFNPAGP